MTDEEIQRLRRSWHAANKVVYVPTGGFIERIGEVVYLSGVGLDRYVLLSEGDLKDFMECFPIPE